MDTLIGNAASEGFFKPSDLCHEGVFDVPLITLNWSLRTRMMISNGESRANGFWYEISSRPHDWFWRVLHTMLGDLQNLGLKWKATSALGFTLLPQVRSTWNLEGNTQEPLVNSDRCRWCCSVVPTCRHQGAHVLGSAPFLQDGVHRGWSQWKGLSVVRTLMRSKPTAVWCFCSRCKVKTFNYENIYIVF